MFGENRLTGTLPANITKIPTLRQLYAAVRCPRLRPACLRFNRASLQERHVQLARRRRVRDSADERHCVCSRLRPLAPLLLGPQLPPPLGEPASRGRQQAPKTAEDAFPDAMRTHPCPKAPNLRMAILACRSHRLATVACSLSLFPQRGTCAGTAERVGQDQSTLTFGRCVSTAVRCSACFQVMALFHKCAVDS